MDFFNNKNTLSWIRILWYLAVTVYAVFLSWCAGKKDFLMVADVLNVKVIEVRDQVNLFERFIPRIYNSRASAKIRLCVCHK